MNSIKSRVFDITYKDKILKLSNLFLVIVTADEAEVEDRPEVIEPKWVETPDGQIEVEDPDDYLIYLEDILKRIHELVLLSYPPYQFSVNLLLVT